MEHSQEQDQTDKYIAKNNIIHSNNKKHNKDNKTSAGEIQDFGNISEIDQTNLRKSNNFVGIGDGETLNPD